MTSKLDQPMERGTSPLLPALREGQNSLVAPTKCLNSPTRTPRQKASQWAQETRSRINHTLEKDGEINEEDLQELKQELISVFIVALQQDSRPAWVYLHEVLGIIEPYKEYLDQLDTKSEFFHYVERIFHHVELHKERLFDLQITDSISKVFPKEVAILRQIGAHPARNYCSVPPVQVLRLASVSSFHMVPKKTSQSPRQSMLLPDGSNPYSTHIPHEDDKLLLTKPLTVGDLRKSIADVAFEMATRESIWTQNYGNMTMALQTDIPEEVDQTSPKEPSTPVRKASITPRSSVSSLSSPKKQSKTPRSTQEEHVPVMTGREAVEYFAKLHHIGKIQSIYFNIVPSRHYRPYELISTHKNKANPEHYVFSTFGVLHVYSDQPAESMSLSEWQRQAVLWTAVSHIPFFKNFLIRKMFYKWRYNKLYLDFARQREAMGSSLLQAIPSFGVALLQVYRLLKELITVKFLPFDTDKCYQLLEFENLVNYKNIQGEKILEKFFRYCKMVVDVTAEESFKKLHYCEEQVRKKTVFSKDSLHMQRLKKETREDNLRRARSETSRLGNFVKLVDQMIVEHLFHISKIQVISFVEDVLSTGHEESREGFFSGNLIFTKHDVLGLSPGKEKFIKVLSSTLKGIPSVLCANAIPMDGSITDHDTTGDDTESSAPKSEVTKSIDNLRKERRKSTAATTVSSIKQESHTRLSDQLDKTTAASVAGETIAGETTAGDTDQDSQIGEVTKSVICDEEILYPDLPKQVPATKDEDEMGVATPSLVMHDEGGALLVTGEGFMGQYNPLTRANLEEKLEMDEEFQKTLKIQREIIEASLEEIDQYCEANNWLNEIHLFCKRWNDKSVQELRGEAAFRIERKLNDMRQWSEKVRNFDRSFTTENGLFLVDCSAIHEWLLPRLSEIYEEVVTFVADEAKNLADSFCEEIKVAIENMKDKQKGVDTFAVFAKNYNQYKKNSQQYQQRVEYIKSLYEVIRMSSRQLTSEEEKIEENAWAMWEMFLLQMQDASEFVNTETPVMTQLLEDTYQKLEKEALELAEMASSKDFLDPNQNATRVLMEMRKIRDKFYVVQEKLHQASKSREAICGEPYDLTFLDEIIVKMDVRQELWKYVEVANHAIKDWKQMLFKKMNIKKALEKVMEWQAAAGKLKQFLPPGDLVLSNWFTRLQDFKKDLPILHKLANDALKERHWKAIFVGMNESFDPDKQYTVADLLAFDLDGHSQLIHTIYLGAIAEYDLEINIAQVKKFWEERQFKLAKHIPDSIFSSKDLPKKPNSPRRRTKLEKFRQERAAAKAGKAQGMNVEDDDFFILIEVDDLKYQLEDSRITITAMMQSPYLGDMRQEVEFWDSALQQVEEITDLWFLCQKKWLYLLKVFEKADLFKKYFKQSQEFEEVHSKFKDWMRVVSLDSKVLTVVNRKRGEKGYRLLQGDNLRSLFLTLIQKQEEILKFLDELIGDSRMDFPRLYFLSNEEMVELLGISRNPKALLPFAKKCFPGINTLTYDLPPGTSSINSILDFALNVDKLQVTTMHGIMGEEIPLYVRLRSFPVATKWLKTLEHVMKNTMAVVLEACVQARMEEGSRQPIHLLEELSKYTQSKAAKPETTSKHSELRSKLKGNTSEIKQTFRHWLLRFPVQSVLVSEGILWEKSVNRALERGELDDLKFLSANLTTKLAQYVELLKESRNFNGNISPEIKKRLNALLCNLVNQTTYHRNIVEAMISGGTCSDSNFEWLCVLRYHMDIQTVLRAKTEPLDPDGLLPQPPPRKAGRPHRSTLHAKFRVEATIEEPPKLYRTKTTVSNDYQFSPCYLHQLGNVFNYDYEYHGPINRLILTPLTERAFLSLTQAVKNFHCGTLIGPPGTGKSETIKELAKMFGRNIFTVNCNEDITVNMMNQFMIGMIQTGSFGIFDDTNRLTKGLMSVTAQNIDYLRTALRTLEVSTENQYMIRGQPKFDKKTGVGDKVIRRNSLTTLHPMPSDQSQPNLSRQKTVPHGFNEKGLVTYFEDVWISEKERRRRHSIEREIQIKESDLYKSIKPPPLFYEHVKYKGKKAPAAPDYSKLLPDTVYSHRMLGNVMFNGMLLQASANFGCFMTLNTANPASCEIPDAFRQLMRPCALILPDFQQIIEITLCCHGFHENKHWAKKLSHVLNTFKTQLPRKCPYQFGFKDVKNIMSIAAAKLNDDKFLQNLTAAVSESSLRTNSASSTGSSKRELDQKSVEEHCLVHAIKAILLPSIEDEDDKSIFFTHLRDTFPLCSSSRTSNNYSYDKQLVKTIKDQLKEDNLKETEELLTKILQLNAAIEMKHGVIMCGQSGSGKTTCCQTLARALNRLNYLLFAPDHTKDELSTDKDIVYHAKQILPFEQKVDVQPSKSSKKLQKAGTLTAKVNDALHEMQVTGKALDHAEHPKVDIIRLNPTALSPQEFLGTFSNGMWQGGLFPKILKDSAYLHEATKTYIASFKDKKTKGQPDHPSLLLRWIILDGVMHPVWTESLNTVFDDENMLSLANGGRISLQDSTSLMYETDELRQASPATVSRCTIVHFSSETTHWSSIFECWVRSAKSRWVITTACLRIWEDLVRDIFGSTIKFLNNECSTALLTDVGYYAEKANEITPGIQEVTTFIRFLSALLDKALLRDEVEKKSDMEGNMHDATSSRQAISRMTSSSKIEQFMPNYTQLMKGMFAFAYIWSFGGHLHEKHRDRFSKFAHDSLYRATHPIRMPLGGTVFDYCLDEATGSFMRWGDKQQERTKVLAGGFTLTTEVEKYSYLLDLLLSAHQPVLLTGMPGVGKTALIQNLVLPKHPSTQIIMSRGMTSGIFQNSMVSHILELKHKSTNILPGPGGSSNIPKVKQRHLFFIDDLNMAASTEGAYQPSLELLRQILSQGGTYDRQRQEFQDMEEATFLAATTVPSSPGLGLGQACHVMSSRLTRLFINLSIFTANTETLMNMYGRSIQNWLEEFPTYSIEHHFEFARAMSLGLLEIYHRIREKFKPTPAHVHYVFSLRDISQVIQGILLMSPRSRTRKMMRRKKDGDTKSKSQKQAHDTRSMSVTSNIGLTETGVSAPMMKVIAQLWCHECTRVFSDRLISDEDKNWFSRLLEEVVLKQFCMAREDPKAEMAAISEETYSQTGRVTPMTTSPLPLTPGESYDDDQAPEVLDKELDDQMNVIPDYPPPEDAKDSNSPSTKSPEDSTLAQSITIDMDRGADDTEIDTALSSRNQPVVELDHDSESEYETEASETTEATSESDSTDSESNDTARGQATNLPAAGAGQGRVSHDSNITDSGTRSTDTSTEDSSVQRGKHKSDQRGFVQSTESGHSSRASQGAVPGKAGANPSLKQQGRGNLKLKTVTFKAGLLADWEHEAYFGPLMSLEEVKAPFDSLTDFIFSKFYMTTYTENMGMSTIEKGYVEGQEEVLAEALASCLYTYNTGISQRLELVFFSDAIRHAARLSRVLAIQGGHALLLGMSYCTGRVTLARLAAYIAHCKLFEPKPQTDPSKNVAVVREHIKRACNHTGVQGKPTVLLIHEALGSECLQDVCSLMAEGTSPGLYSEDEIQSIVSHMMPGGVQTKRVDKIDQAFERFLKKIRQNLHVIVCLNYKGNSFNSDFRALYKRLSSYPGLIKYSCSVDVYRQWPYEAYVRMAQQWLQDTRSKIHIPWHPTRMIEQVNMTSNAMAYIHLSAKRVIERQFCHQKEPLRFFSPLTFMEFVHLFRVISAYIVKTEKENIRKHEQALSKVNEAFGSIAEFKREVSDLTPQHQGAVEEIKDLVAQVEDYKLRYIEALDKCKEQEEKIEELQGPLEQLRREAQTEFDKVNPNYQAALTALESLNRRDLDEVRSFRTPPELVEFVLNALCLLFDVPQNWESAKQLLIRENFIEDMMFYDKDNIPEEIFERLGNFVDHPNFQPEKVKSVSMAVTGICVWVHAVYKYADIHRHMQPRLKNLLEHEELFTQAQAKLGQLRVEANRIKSALEKKIVGHKAAVKRAKTIEKHMQSIEKRIARAVNLMEHMSMQHFLWKSELKKARHHVLTAPGDALITAACVVYHGPIEDKYRAELMQDWLDRCKQGHFVLDRFMGQEIFPVSSNMEALQDGLRDKDAGSDASSSHAGEGSVSESTTSGLPSLPEITTFRYTPAIYDTSKYYKSELRKQGSIEYESVPNVEVDDSDDEDEQSPLMNRSGFILQDLLSEFDELSKWRLDNLPTDLHSVQNALFMRVSCHNRKHCWPLLIDPDNQAEMWVKALQTSRNVFSESDVRSGSPDYSEMVPVEPGQDSGSDQLPPSRGTGLTFSDFTTEIPLDDGTTSESNIYTSQTDYSVMKSGRQSGQTWNTEDMRPVTSVTNSWETSYSFRVEQNLEAPDFNLWIIEADDQSLGTKLINAIVHGVTVLVTHLERKPLDPLFRGLLLKQFYVDKAGNRIIKVGSNEFQYHPDFCLYLSTSVPLFLKGDGLHNVPLHRMCIINMALSDEAIMNRLLIETMKVERKEFEGQKRSNENDIILHRQRLVKEHEMIREKTLMLDVPLLEDKTMLESLLACQKEVEKNRLILEETRYMGDHLEEKFATYTPMIMQTAVLYNMIKKMGVLHPYYYIPFYKFIEIYSSVIKGRDRGKGSLGAAQARAQELADATFYSIFKYISMMMFEQHFTLLQLLVAMERMRMTRKTSIKELSFFVNGFDKQGLDETSLLEHKPHWMGNQEWINCLVIEQLHHPFHGLRRSLIQNSTQWEEYFRHSIALMNPVPGTTLQELSVFQKCLLWKICCPHRLSELATAMILYDFGSIRMVPDHYNVREVYSYTDKTTPVMFILPNAVYDAEASEGTKGYSYISPTHEVRRLAKEVGMEGKVRVMNFGVKGQISEVRNALEDCLQSGYWLLVQNYHLAEEPEQGFFDLLKEIVYSKWLEQERHRQQTQVPDEGSSLVTYSKPSDNPQNDLFIHNTFRLWITTQSDRGRLLPGVLNQHGIKVTCEKTGNFKSTLQKSYKSVAFLLSSWKVDDIGETWEDRSARIMPLALLHSLLIQQSYYGNHAFTGDNHWSLTDLALAVDAYKKVMWKCDNIDGMKELISQTYYNHCTDAMDAKVVWALASLLADQALSDDKQDSRCRSEDITALLDNLLLKPESGIFNLKKSVDSLDEHNTAKTVGLPESADASIIAGYSRIMSKDMIQVIGAPELFLRVTTDYDSTVITADTILIPQLITAIQKFSALPETSKTQVYPLDIFLHFEVQGFRKLIHNIQSDLGLIQRRAKGEILPASHLDDVIIALNSGKVPDVWLKQTFPSCTSVKQWICEMSVKIERLTSYVRDQSSSCRIYNLSDFLRPDRFLDAVKHTYARKHFKDVNNVELEIQVMPAGLKPSVAPKDGVFISGLYLHNALWDTTRAVLMYNTADSKPVQEMPVIWLKPRDISSPSKNTIKYELYKCPVYCSDDPSIHGDKNVVTCLDLPTLQHPVVWYQQRVFMSSAM